MNFEEISKGKSKNMFNKVYKNRYNILRKLQSILVVVITTQKQYFTKKKENLPSLDMIHLLDKFKQIRGLFCDC
jgi:hypothetical protein